MQLWERELITSEVPFLQAMRFALGGLLRSDSRQRRAWHVCLVAEWVQLAGEEIADRIQGKKKQLLYASTDPRTAEFVENGVDQERWERYWIMCLEYATETGTAQEYKIALSMRQMT